MASTKKSKIDAIRKKYKKSYEIQFLSLLLQQIKKNQKWQEILHSP
jgi:hypothetical protein